MNRAWLNLIRPLVPVRAVRWLRLKFGWQWFRGDYLDWATAREASTGYDDAAVLARVLAATREVRSGRAGWERDGVVFQTVEVNAPLLAQLRRIAADTGGRLDVVDFGGALGSTWWQHREALADLPEVHWRVVEQPHYVAAGHEFTDAQLSFHDSLAGALASGGASVLLLSSVLPYLESPFGLLEEIASRGFRHVVVDRTPFVRTGRTRLVVQHTPAELGGGSYPCWLFDEAALLAPLRAHYGQVANWQALDQLDPGVEHRGYHFQLR